MVADGDVNCDDRITVADLTELSTLIPSGSFGPCGLADVNRDGLVDDLDQSALIAILFGPSPRP